ncbi:glycosyltransferase family 2 protein [Rhodococcus sp. H29-C3]|uniref:glycosyltransferase family 2 protein n=1 Tax=Rhodococcus sp. H29-C3 TaxID=3046307 RepID=UPI0024BB2976|nr:glycosyltransferase family 2 protein [Rhodococcus sp. H29-C3]MDJ0360862.1 glycosyltransferase family 2 protein [Rhodococcus sp. H29-C3]
MVASVSICVPAYNAGRTLDTTLRSILEQDVDVEVVVLDNASRDDTGVIAHSVDDSRVRVIRNDVVLPIGDNWNKAVALSTGRLVKVVCADDILLPGSLESQVRVMDDRGIAISSARFDVIDEDGGVQETGLGVPGLEGLQTPRSLMRLIVRRGPADFGPTAAAMFRREDFDSVGGFRGDLVFPMDVDLFARVCVYGMFFGISERLAAWRDSRFNLCSQTSTYSKLSDLLRFHHRIAREYPEFVTGADVMAGDMRLVRAAFARVVVRTNALVSRHPAVGV